MLKILQSEPCGLHGAGSPNRVSDASYCIGSTACQARLHVACMSLLPWFLLWLRGWFGGFVWCFGRVFAAAVRNAQVRHTPHPTAVCMPKRKGPQFLPRVDLAAADALVAQAHGAPVAANPTGLIAHAPRKVQALSGASTPVAPTFVRPGRSSRGDVAVIKDHTRASFEVALGLPKTFTTSSLHWRLWTRTCFLPRLRGPGKQ